MRVIFFTRMGSASERGGDYLSLDCMIKELERLGVECTVEDDSPRDLAPFDIVNIYNLDVPIAALEYFVHARGQLKRIVTTPIYWRHTYWPDEVARNLATRPMFEPLESGGQNDRARTQLVKWLEEQFLCAADRFILTASEKVCAKSHSEADLLAADFGLPNEKICVSPNGVESLYSDGNAWRFVEQYGLRDFVLCVGRIEERKNTLGVIRAWRNESVPLVFVGRAWQEDYMARCRAEASDNVIFLGSLAPEQVADACAAARVHVQASWWEERGRASMEAGVAGCNLVVTQNSPARELYGDDCFLCDPADPQSIHRAICDALAAPRASDLPRRLRERFNWEKAARNLLYAYQEVLDKPLEPLPASYYSDLLELTDRLTELLELKEPHYASITRQVNELEGWTKNLSDRLAEQEAERARWLNLAPVRLARRLKHGAPRPLPSDAGAK